MLSYRHGFHAGSFADVHKHIILVAILSYLQKKAKPYSYIDTHAGAGLYPLDLDFMQKNKEYENGIAKLWQKKFNDPVLKKYLQIVRQCNPSDELTQYPGSPLIAAHLLNPQDKLHAIEFHPNEFPLLQQALKTEKRAKVHHLNAYDALLAFLPPPAKRGLVLVDPSYEVKTEYQQVVELIQKACIRFSTGIYAIWYPIVDRAHSQRFVKQFKKTKMSNMLCSEWCIGPDTDGYGMTGSGMIILNPPYTFKQTLENTQKILQEHLQLHSAEVHSIYEH